MPTPDRLPAGRGRRKPRDPRATREALLAAGLELFARRGFAGATADAIARRAGVNKAMIHYHFRSKQGLYDAILLAALSEVKTRLAAVAPSRPAPEQLEAFVAIFAAAARRSPDFPAMLLREVLAGGERIGKAFLGEIAGILGAVRGMVERGVREGSLRPVDPLLTHLSVAGSLIFFFATTAFRERLIVEARIAARPPAPEAFVKHLQELMIRGLAAGRRPGAARRR